MTIITYIKSIMAKLKGKGAPEILLGSFLVKVAGFLGSIIVVRLLSKSDYGVLSYMENIYTYAFLIAGLGLNNAVFRFVVLAEDRSEKRGIFDWALSRGTVFNVALVFVLIVLFFFWPHSSDFSAAGILLPIIIFALPFQYACDTAQYTLRALFLNKAYALAALLTVMLVWAGKVIGAGFDGLHGVALSYPLSYIAICVGLLLYLHFSQFSGARPKKVERKRSREMLLYSAQYMITNGMWALFLQNDLMLLGLISGDSSAVADYKVAYAIPTILSIVSSSIGIFVSPYFVKNERDKSWVMRNYRRVFLCSFALIAGGASLVAILAGPLIEFVYGHNYLNIVPLMYVLLVSAILNNAIRYTAANLLAAMGKIRINMLIAFFGIVSQILLNIILIPQFGAYGCAITSVLVYLGMAIATNVAFIKHNAIH